MNARLPHEPSRLRPLLIAAYALATLGMVLRSLVEVFRTTKAIEPREFPAGELLDSTYEVHVLVHLCFGLLVLLLAALDIRRRLRTNPGEEREAKVAFAGMVVALVGQALSYVHGFGSLLAGGGLLIAFLNDESRDLRRGTTHFRDATRLVEGLTLSRMKRVAPEILILPALGFLLSSSLEITFFTSQFAGKLFTFQDYYEFIILATSASIITGFRFSIEFAALLLVIRRFHVHKGDPHKADVVAPALWFSAAYSFFTAFHWRWEEVVLAFPIIAFLKYWTDGDRNGVRKAFLLPLFASVYFLARLKSFVFRALQDEIDKLGLTWLTYTAFGLLAVFACVWTYFGLKAIFSASRPRGLRDVLTAVTLSFIVPGYAYLMGPVSRGISHLGQLFTRTVFAGLLSLLLCSAVLVELNYPLVTDFSQVAQVIYSMLLGLAAFLFLYLCYSCFLKRRFLLAQRTFPITIGLIALAHVTYLFYADNQVPRMIGAQYAKIVTRTIDMARLYPEPLPISLAHEDKPEDIEAYRLRRMERFPTLQQVPQVARFEKRKPLTIFVLWDAARADHTSVYGYERDTTPALRSIAEDGIVFERCYSSATATTTSMRHIFTGRYSSRYMLETNHDPYFVGRLVEAGYHTLIINGHGTDFNGISEESFYRAQANPEPIKQAMRFFTTYREQPKTKEAIAMLDEELARRDGNADGIFIYLHCASMHYPWINWPDHEVYGEGLVDRYDNSIGHADKALGDLMDALKQRGLYEDAMVLLTADHGTGLNEHGKYGGFQPYEEQLRVPLVMKVPGFAQRRVTQTATGIDIAPTLVSLFNPGAENPYHGHSLLTVMAVENATIDRKYIMSICAFEDALALIDIEDQFKFHFHREDRYQMLYDLASDPDERRNLADQHRDRCELYSKVIQIHLWEGRNTYANPYHYRAFEPD